MHPLTVTDFTSRYCRFMLYSCTVIPYLEERGSPRQLATLRSQSEVLLVQIIITPTLTEQPVRGSSGCLLYDPKWSRDAGEEVATNEVAAVSRESSPLLVSATCDRCICWPSPALPNKRYLYCCARAVPLTAAEIRHKSSKDHRTGGKVL